MPIGSGFKSSTLCIVGYTGNTGNTLYSMYGGISLYESAPRLESFSSGTSLFISGVSQSGFSYIDLFISGPVESTSYIPLYIYGQGVEDSCSLYIKGKWTNSDFPLLFGSGVEEDCSLYVYGTGNDPAGIYSTGTKRLNLYIYGAEVQNSGTAPLYSYGSIPINNSMPLGVSGVNGYLSSGMALYTAGLGYNSGTLDLFIRGF